MAKTMKQLEGGIQKMKTELKQHAKPQSRDDKFADRMKVSTSYVNTGFNFLFKTLRVLYSV